MKDFKGKSIKAGDKVITTTQGGRGSHASLSIATVRYTTPKGAKVDFDNEKSTWRAKKGHQRSSGSMALYEEASSEEYVMIRQAVPYYRYDETDGVFVCKKSEYDEMEKAIVEVLKDGEVFSKEIHKHTYVTLNYEQFLNSITMYTIDKTVYETLNSQGGHFGDTFVHAMYEWAKEIKEYRMPTTPEI